MTAQAAPWTRWLLIPLVLATPTTAAAIAIGMATQAPHAYEPSEQYIADLTSGVDLVANLATLVPPLVLLAIAVFSAIRLTRRSRSGATLALVVGFVTCCLVSVVDAGYVITAYLCDYYPERFECSEYGPPLLLVTTALALATTGVALAVLLTLRRSADRATPPLPQGWGQRPR